MKHCPECNRNYADPTLSFCLEDGAPLLYGEAEEPATAILTSAHSDIQFTKLDPSKSVERADSGSGRRGWQKIVAIAAAIVVVVGAAGAYLYRASSHVAETAKRCCRTKPFAIIKTGNSRDGLSGLDVMAGRGLCRQHSIVTNL